MSDDNSTNGNAPYPQQQPDEPAVVEMTPPGVVAEEYEDGVPVELLNPKFKFPDPAPRPQRQFFNNSGAPWWAWPDPIDNTLVRLSSFFIFCCALSITIANHECHDVECKEKAWYLVYVMLYDFVVRTAFGPTPFSVFGMLATAILYLLNVEPNLVPSSAKRFSFFLGIVLNTVVTILFWIVATEGAREFAGRPMIVLTVFAGLESLGGFCVGCWFFKTFFQLRDKWQNRRDYAKLAIVPTPAKRFLNPTTDGPDDDRTHTFDVDLVVIGAGSGGLACAKEAARLGKRVVLLDKVPETPHGSTWGVGGTCVNVGCIPKKLFHQAGIVGQHVRHDAWYYGWGSKDDKAVLRDTEYDWTRARKFVQRHIASLNQGYERGFKDAKLQYINARGSIIDAHTVRLCSGPCESITTRRIVIAVGGRPKYDDKVPGSELCITSDDLFSLEKAPGKTLVIGASYIALECAGFLAELGMDTTVMARSKVLRTFDQDMADRIVDNMRQGDVKFLEGFSPVKFEKEPETGRIRVTYKDNAKKSKDAAAAADDDGLLTEVYDTVLSAIGRVPNTANIGLQDLGVELAPNGKVYHHNERTTVPNIYVIGDCGEPSIELTPVAIKQGMLLAQRLYNGSDVTVDFSFYPTTVFTPIEYGTIGVSEERAIEVFGEDQIDVFHAEFTPLEHFLPHRSTTCYVKIIVNYRDKQRIIGLHYLGPNAGEVTQGFAAAFKAGLKKKDFDAIIGIHPTTAEEVVTLRRTKKSGLDPKKTGC